MSLQQYLKVVIFYYTNESHKVFVKSFCGWSVRTTRSYQCEKNKERQELKLGDSQGTPSKYSKDTEASKLGDAPVASHLSSSTNIGIPWFLFCSHDLCPLCFCFFPLRTMLVWVRHSLIYIILHVLHLYILSMIL